MTNPKETTFIQEEDLNLREQIDLYLRHWKWFVLAVIFAFAGAYIYLRYSTPIFQTTASILVKDEDRGGGLSESSILNDLGSAQGFSSVNVEDEKQILSSKSLMGAVVDELELTKQYFVEGNVKTVELYKNHPFEFNFIGEDSLTVQGKSKSLNIQPISESKYKIKAVEDDNFKEFTFGEITDLGFGKFIVVPKRDNEIFPKNFNNANYLVNLIPRFLAVSHYQGLLSIESADKRSSVINLSMQNSVSEKSEDILNNLIKQFNNDAISDKNLISRNTFSFIADRLQIIAQELDSVETNKQEFKTSNNLTDIPSEAQMFIEKNQILDQRLLEVETQMELVKTVINYLLDNSRASDYLPANLGIAESAVSASISEYNQLVLQRDRQLQYGTELNPVVITLNNQIRDLRAGILESLRNHKRSLEITVRELRGQQNEVDSKISSVPRQEKLVREITRQQNIKEELYLYLLRKREETAISLAITAPVAKVIDHAYTQRTPISPKPQIIYLAAFLLGLLIPFLIIYIRNLLDTKIHNKADIEKVTRLIPVLGEVPKIDSKESETIKANDRSMLAESFRILRTNLSYFVKSKEEDSKNVIYVTSTVKGEGKTFVAFNLALTLASTGQKVLLIGADIRNPQLHRYIGSLQHAKGLSEYLFDDKVTLESITTTEEINRQQIDILLSGRIPPNPAELLIRERFKTMIDTVREQYDYLVVDTAPAMLVTDTLLISQYADFTIYVSRAEYTYKKLLQFPQELYREKKLRNMAFVVNGVTLSNYGYYGYGNKYGYGYGLDIEPWYVRLRKAIFKR